MGWGVLGNTIIFANIVGVLLVFSKMQNCDVKGKFKDAVRVNNIDVHVLHYLIFVSPFTYYKSARYCSNLCKENRTYFVRTN